MKKQIVIFILLFSIGNFSCKTEKTREDSEKEISPEPDHFEVDKNSFMMKMQAEALKESFKGIYTTNGKEENLFPIKSTGVSTEPIVKAGSDFINSLSVEQRNKTVFPIEDDEWRMWSNVDHGIYERQGFSLKEMNKKQRVLAFDLMAKSLSAKGLQLSKDIMKTDQTLREFNNNEPFFDEELYYFTFMGEPSKTEPWGWQIDGHHLVINYFVMGDQVVMTPTFMGGEPIITTSGKYKGNVIFQDEQDLGLKFVNSLPEEQQEVAIISSSKSRHDAKSEAFKDNIILDYEGLNVSELSEPNKKSLLHLIEQYILNMEEGHGQVKMEEIKSHFNNTYFAWIGTTDKDAVFYYRIHSPVILIEFDHQGAVGVKSKIKGATRNHIHTVVRTPNGNDYGKDLLRQHLEDHHH